MHGHARIDNYYWLNNREDPEVIAYLNAENSYTEKMMKHTEKFQEELFNEIVGRIKQTDMSVPYKKNEYYYYARYEEGKEYPVYCRKHMSLDAEEEILLDVNEMASVHDYYQVTGLNVSPDNKILAFGVDIVSRRQYTIHFKDLITGEISSDNIPNTTGSVAWANDNKNVFYSIKDHTLRSYKILRHKLETKFEDDKEIFHESDETYFTFVYKTKSEKYIVIGSNSTLSTEYRYLSADQPEGEFQIIQKRERGLEYSIDHYQDKFFIVTNLDAKNFRLMSTNENQTAKENWKEVIPHRNDVLMEGIEIFSKYLVIQERKNGLTQLRIINWKDNNEYYIPFDEAAYLAYLSTNLDFDTNILRYGYTSLVTPNSTYDFNMKTKEKVLLKQEEILGDYKKENYVTERIYVPAKDGAKIPVSLVYKKDTKIDGSSPLLLYGYGSYGISTDATFNSSRLSLLDRGVIYAIAHIRGGEELGREWYEDGKLLKKKNTFSDFIDCAEYLIDKKYTNTGKLFALGGSAGGLLVGAVMNMKPELFKGIIAAVPFVDVVTTMLDDSIPLTTAEYDEWGNPHDKEYYNYMMSYSPYDNVERKNYPNLLVTTGLHDSQVQYWEPAKWVAKLRDMKTDNNLLLLDTDMSSGHGGASGRFQRYKRLALQYAFIFDLLNIKK